MGEPACICMLSSTAVLVFYANLADQYGYAVVGTRTNDAIAWGTPAKVTTTTETPYPLAICALSSTQAIVAYGGITGSAYAMVINISGTTPSGNTAHIVGAGTNARGVSIDKTSATQAIMTWRDVATYAVALTVASSLVTVGSILTVSSSVGANTAVSNISSTAAMILWPDSTNSGKPTAMIISISGQTLTTNTAYVVDSVASNTVCEIAQLSTTLFVVGYNDASNTYSAALSVAATVITVGAPVTVNTVSHTNAKNALCIVDTTDVMYNYIDGSGNLQGRTGSISGTTITLNGVTQIVAATQQNPVLCNFDTNHSFVAYNNSGGSPVISGVVLSIV